MNVLKTSALLIGLAMAPWIGSNAVVDVAAWPLATAIQATPERTTAIEQVQQPRYPRRPYRTPTYRYYYDGGWYATPWWFWFGPYSFGYGTPYPYGYGTPDYWNAHVQWCFDRYRSYDARTDTFLGYDGLRHRCRSPYRR